MEKEFRQKIQEHLRKLELDIEKSILELTSYEYPSEVSQLDFEIFSDNFTKGSPIRVFFLDKDNNEFFVYANGKAEYPSPINPELLEIDFVYPASLEKEYENKIENYNPWKMATEEFVKWFLIIWKSTKNEHFKLKATIGHHDEWKKFDLMKEKWIET